MKKPPVGGQKLMTHARIFALVLSSIGIHVYLWTAGHSYILRSWSATAAVTIASMVFSSIFARFVDAPSVKLAQQFGNSFRASIMRVGQTNAPSRKEARE
ncbi:hypothetical protein [Burkholderia multivorans]|uniref:hypothetical protein n=1 Tax=Burkholderia multivorans TaxID=87883 RepID=UPI0020189FDB|nr:hypothetical protein [Burkholderia multivorans]MCO1402836.1 hypothetical protein [Burkholderia multivorans]UQO78637.1 hypothetical protein L0Z12_06305 [Burkholderia multivorans]